MKLRKMLQVQDGTLILTNDGAEIMAFYARSIAPLMQDFAEGSRDTASI